MHTEFWWGNHLENVHLKNRELNGRISKWMIGKKVVRVAGG
jgi:hypothetical protein